MDTDPLNSDTISWEKAFQFNAQNMADFPPYCVKLTVAEPLLQNLLPVWYVGIPLYRWYIAGTPFYFPEGKPGTLGICWAWIENASEYEVISKDPVGGFRWEQ